MTLSTLWQQMRNVRLPIYQPGWQTPIIDGQSLSLGFDGSPTQEASLRYISREGVRMLTGLQRSDNAAVWLHGPSAMTYNATPASAIAYGGPNGNAPMCFTFALALDKWRQTLGLPLTRMIVGFNGVAGQGVAEFNDDAPTPDGTLGTLIRDNHTRWLTEAATLAPGIAPMFYALMQGEANVSMTQAQYLAAATDAVNDALDDIQAATGIRPPLAVIQVAGYRDSRGDAYGPPLAQLQMVDDMSGLFLGPIYPHLLHDNVHLGWNGQLLCSEAAAYIYARHEQGARVDMTPEAPQVVGNQVTVPFRTDGKSLAFDTGKYDAYGGLNDHGVEVSGTTISSVTISGRALVITAAAALSGRTLSIAMQSQDMSSFSDAQGEGYAAHRSDVMEAAPEDSLLVAGAKMKRFVPSCRWQF